VPPTRKNLTKGNGAVPPSVGGTVLKLRRARSLTLEALSQKSGVSKSMLSQIERNRTNPTFATVWRLTEALGVRLDEVFHAEEQRSVISVVQSHATPVIASADGKCRLRILGPVDLGGVAEWYDMSSEPGGVLSSDPHETGTMEHLTVLEGSFRIVSGEETTDVNEGETARYAADCPHEIRNAADGTARALLVVMTRRAKNYP